MAEEDFLDRFYIPGLADALGPGLMTGARMSEVAGRSPARGYDPDLAGDMQKMWRRWQDSDTSGPPAAVPSSPYSLPSPPASGRYSDDPEVQDWYRQVDAQPRPQPVIQTSGGDYPAGGGSTWNYSHPEQQVYQEPFPNEQQQLEGAAQQAYGEPPSTIDPGLLQRTTERQKRWGGGVPEADSSWWPILRAIDKLDQLTKLPAVQHGVSLGFPMAGPVNITRAGRSAYFDYYPKGATPEDIKGTVSILMGDKGQAPYWNSIWSNSVRGTRELMEAVASYLKPSELNAMQLSDVVPEAIPFWQNVARRLENVYPELVQRIRGKIAEAQPKLQGYGEGRFGEEPWPGFFEGR